MIQRFQTVLLAAALIVNLMILPAPVWFVENTFEEKSIYLYGTQRMYTTVSREIGEKPFQDTYENFTSSGIHLTMVFLLIAVCLILGYAIFKFRNRLFQVRLCYAAIILAFLQVLFTIFVTKQMELELAPKIPDEFTFISSFKFAFFFPIIVILLTFWGSMRIRKDEMLVKESNRLR